MYKYTCNEIQWKKKWKLLKRMKILIINETKNKYKIKIKNKIKMC